MAQVAKVMPSVAPQNVGVNRPVTYTRGAGRPAAPSFVPIEELSAAVGVASYGDAAIFQEADRGGAEHDEAPPSRQQGPFTAPSQIFANIVEQGQVSGERRATGAGRGQSAAIVTLAIGAYEASARINTGVVHPRGESFNTNF